jgi:hypothetical protein
MMPASSQPQTSAAPENTSSGPCGALGSSWESSDGWRFGFGLAESADAEYWADQLQASWYLDWDVKAGPVSAYPQHWQMVRVSAQGTRPGLERVINLAASYPGGTWLIGNEPDVIWQDNTTPERYAEHYHTLYTAIKDADPSAQVSVGGISMVSALRLAYLERVLEFYLEQYDEPLPTDLWNIHVYILREQRDSWGVEIPPGIDVEEGALWEIADHGRIDLFEEQLRTFRSWMRERGYQDKPLAVTEYGILMPNSYGFPEHEVRQYLRETINRMLTLRDQETGYPADGFRLVQQWAWFSLAFDLYPTGNLANLERKALTSLGEQYRDCVLAVGGADKHHGKP